MAAMARSVSRNAGPGSAFDRLPDHLLLQILVKAAECPSGNADVEDRALLHKLCQLRLVCSRFDTIVLQADNISWSVQGVQGEQSGALHFLQESQGLKSLQVESKYEKVNPLQEAFIHALGSATAKLDSLTVCAPNLESSHTPDEAQTHGLFRTLALCPHLQSFKLDIDQAPLLRPLSTRYPLKSLRVLNLANAALGDACLTSILGICTSLEVLDISFGSRLQEPVIVSSSLGRLTVNNDSLCEIGLLQVKAPQLTKMEIACAARLTVEAPKLKDIYIVCPEQVDLGRVPELDTMKLDMTMNWKDIVRVLESGKAARSLTIEDYRLVQGEYEQLLYGHPLLPPKLRFPNLETLVVSFNVEEDSPAALEGWLNLCKVAERLEVLDISLPKFLDEKLGMWIMKILEFQKEYPSIKITVASGKARET